MSYRSWMGGTGAMVGGAAAALLVSLLLYGPEVAAFTGVVILVIAVPIVVLTRRYFRRARVSVSGGRVTQSHADKLRKEELSEVDHAVFVPAVSYSYWLRHMPYTSHLFLLDRRGRCVLRLSGNAWSHEDMRRLVEAIGCTVTAYPTAISAYQLLRDFPGAISQWEGRPQIFIYPTFGVFAVLMVILKVVS